MKKKSFRQGAHPLFGPRNGQKLENKSKENEESFDFSFKNKKETVISQFRDLSVIVSVIVIDAHYNSK